MAGQLAHHVRKDTFAHNASAKRRVDKTSARLFLSSLRARLFRRLILSYFMRVSALPSHDPLFLITWLARKWESLAVILQTLRCSSNMCQAEPALQGVHFRRSLTRQLIIFHQMKRRTWRRHHRLHKRSKRSTNPLTPRKSPLQEL